MFLLLFFMCLASQRVQATLHLLHGNHCRLLEFMCDDGACVRIKAVCDGKSDCADDSDEEYCDTSKTGFLQHGILKHKKNRVHALIQHIKERRRLRNLQNQKSRLPFAVNAEVGRDHPSERQPPLLGTRFGASETSSTPNPTPPCVLPEYPDRGNYTSVDKPEAKPGQEYSFITLIFSCRSDYALEGSVYNHCSKGVWQHPFPKCVRLCRLNLNSNSVEYICQVSNTNGGTRPCNAVEPAGTVVEAKCRVHFYSPTMLPVMRCYDGYWDYMPQCVPECGKVTPEGSQLVAGGTRARHGELPWHVGVYKQSDKTKYLHICGGTIVAKSLVISAAHCFWNDATKLQNASLYAVAAGKIYRSWDEQRDTEAQKSNVSRIIVPDLFFGAETHFDYDVAILILTTPFEYKNFICPVCISFNMVLEAEQLRVGSYGKVAGWGFTSAREVPSGVLQVVDLPYMDEGTCLLRAPVGYRDLITNQKFCAGSIDGKTVCHGDSGGGLVFPSKDLGVVRYYLRGVVSTTPRGFPKCDPTTFTTFSLLSKLEKYIQPYLTIY